MDEFRGAAVPNPLVCEPPDVIVVLLLLKSRATMSGLSIPDASVCSVCRCNRDVTNRKGKQIANSVCRLLP